MTGLIGYDLGKAMTGDYYYTVCTSRKFLRIRERFFPGTLKYETRYQPKIDLVFAPTPLFSSMPRRVHPRSVCNWKAITTKDAGEGMHKQAYAYLTWLQSYDHFVNGLGGLDVLYEMERERLEKYGSCFGRYPLESLEETIEEYVPRVIGLWLEDNPKPVIERDSPEWDDLTAYAQKTYDSVPLRVKEVVSEKVVAE